MNLLKELFNLSEANIPGDNAIELAELIKNFPNQHKKAIERLWGSPRLQWHGIPFIGDVPDVYEKAETAIKKYVADMEKHGGIIQVSIDTELDGHATLEYDDPSDPTEVGQECYMGYDPKTDTIYIGYDTFLSEDIFNEEWDSFFKQRMGETFEYEDPEHEKLFSKAHAQFIKYRAWVMFSVTADYKIDVQHFGDKGFYHEGHQHARDIGLIDLRLD